MPEKTRDQTELSARTMLTLGGIMTAGVAVVLGMVTLVGRAGDGGPDTPVRPAAGRQGDASADPARMGRAAITAHVAVPPTDGLDEQTARVRLRATRLVVGDVQRIPSGLPAGRVVRTSPAAGTGLPAGGRVTLYVSTG